MRVLFAFLASMIFIAGASAAPIWSAPGWYHVADTEVGLILWKGPFASEDECKSSLPASDEDADYFCQYLATQPPWDD